MLKLLAFSLFAILVFGCLATEPAVEREHTLPLYSPTPGLAPAVGQQIVPEPSAVAEKQLAVPPELTPPDFPEE